MDSEAEGLLSDLINNTEKASHAFSELQANTTRGNYLRCCLVNENPDVQVDWKTVNEIRIKCHHGWSFAANAFDSRTIKKTSIEKLTYHVEHNLMKCVSHLLERGDYPQIHEAALYFLVFGTYKRKCTTAKFEDLPTFWELVNRINVAIQHNMSVSSKKKPNDRRLQAVDE